MAQNAALEQNYGGNKIINPSKNSSKNETHKLIQLDNQGNQQFRKPNLELQTNKHRDPAQNNNSEVTIKMLQQKTRNSDFNSNKNSDPNTNKVFESTRELGDLRHQHHWIRRLTETKTRNYEQRTQTKEKLDEKNEGLGC